MENTEQKLTDEINSFLDTLENKVPSQTAENTTSHTISTIDLTPERHPDEEFTDYKARRILNAKVVKNYLKGTLVYLSAIWTNNRVMSTKPYVKETTLTAENSL